MPNRTYTLRFPDKTPPLTLDQRQLDTLLDRGQTHLSANRGAVNSTRLEVADDGDDGESVVLAILTADDAGPVEHSARSLTTEEGGMLLSAALRAAIARPIEGENRSPVL
jgi:hypothetical protein